MEKSNKTKRDIFMIVSKLGNATKYFALKSGDNICCFLNFYKDKSILDCWVTDCSDDKPLKMILTFH